MSLPESLSPGRSFAYGPHRVEEAALLAFARVLDPQPMHLDAHSQQAQLMGGLIGSGWQTAAVHHRMILRAGLMDAGLGTLAHVSSLRWPNPVRPGDRLDGEASVLARGPDWVDLRQTLTNQHATPVMTLDARYTASAAALPAADAGIHHDDTQARPVRFLPFDAVPPGTLWAFGEHVFTPEAIGQYRAAYDPAPGASLDAAPWHVAAQWLRLNVDLYHACEASGAPLPQRGPGLGITDVVWPHPAKAGEPLRYFSRVLSARPSASRPGWGILTQRNYALNAGNAPVVAFTSAALLEGAAPGDAP